jgi:hypothetical protein
VSDTVIVLGRTEVGAVAEGYGMRYYLTDCCGASATGTCSGDVACRSCYRDVDPGLGGLPVWDPFVETYGDGISYDSWVSMYNIGST